MIGQAFGGQSVGVRTAANGVIEVRYGPHVVETFSPEQGNRILPFRQSKPLVERRNQGAGGANRR